jgi:hypothetical protein
MHANVMQRAFGLLILTSLTKGGLVHTNHRCSLAPKMKRKWALWSGAVPFLRRIWYKASQHLSSDISVEDEMRTGSTEEAPLEDIEERRGVPRRAARGRQCEHPGCTTRPSYGPPGSTKGQWCREHASAECVDVVSKRCKHPGCTTHPSYGPPGSNNRQWCREHAPADCVDVASKRCKHPGCTTHPSYGPPGSNDCQWCPGTCTN